MSDPITIKKGATYTQVLRWEATPRLYATITGIARSAPVVITAPNHGIPDQWRVDRVSGSKGMTQINTHSLINGQFSRTGLGRRFPNGLIATVVDADTLQFNAVNATDFGAWTAGGVLEYNTPVPLAGYTAKMQIRSSVNSDTVLFELSTVNGRIALDATNYTVTLDITAADTAALTFSSGVTTLEMTAPDGDVAFLITNAPVIVQETDVTR